MPYEAFATLVGGGEALDRVSFIGNSGGLRWRRRTGFGGGRGALWVERKTVVELLLRGIRGLVFRFQPGFPYLQGLPFNYTHHAEPRLLVPAGSLGIGEPQAGVYPLATPGAGS